MSAALPRARKMYLFLLVLTIASFAGFQGWRTLFNNFAVEVGHVDGAAMGLIQSVREVPGLLALLVVYLLAVVSEHRLAALSLAVMGLGVALAGQLPSVWGLAFTTLLMSFGFHYYETVNQSLTLQYFDRSTSPLVFGRLRAVGAATNLAIGGIIFVVSPYFSYSQLFAMIGLSVVVIALLTLFYDPTEKDMVPQHRKMIFKWRYWLFYVLTLLAGARRQIFVAFAVFLLVDHLGFTIREITILFVINNAIGWVVNPIIGKAVNRFGERKVLSLEYIVLIGVFAGYAFINSKLMGAGLYILDHLVFNFAIAIRTFFQKIADPADIAPSMAVGFTINHISAVLIPVIGGAIWLVGFRWVFFSGALLSLTSLVMVQFIPRELARKG